MKIPSISELLTPQGTLICPVCREEFKPNDDTKYIIAGGYVCDWKCFLKESKRRYAEKEAKNKNNKK